MRLKIIALFIVLIGCEPQTIKTTLDTSITISRMSEEEYRIIDDNLTYILRSQNPGNNDTRYMGKGELRIVSALWNHNGETYTILLCGDCAAIPAIRLPGSGVWNWMGPGYGMQSTPDRYMVVDGSIPTIEIGQSRNANRIEIHQTLTGFGANGASNNQASNRKAVIQRSSVISITPGLWHWKADDLALTTTTRDQPSYELGDVYDGRLEAPSICLGGVWHGFRDENGNTFNLDCGSSVQTYMEPHPMGYWTEMISPIVPISLRVTTTDYLGWRNIFNGGHPDKKVKAYQLERAGYSNPLTIMPEEIRHYEHTITVIPN